MIAPSACSPSKNLSCTGCSISFGRRLSSTRRAEPAGTARSWPRAATGSSESIARPRCWRRPVAAWERATFAEGSLTALPLADGSVDAVVCALALVHLPDVDEAIRELARVVRPGGRLIVSDVHPFLILLGWQAQFRTAAGEAGFMRLYPASSLGLLPGLCRRRLARARLPRTAPDTGGGGDVAAERLPDANRAASRDYRVSLCGTWTRLCSDKR